MGRKKAAPPPPEIEQECPILKLTMEKGPLSGQTNEFKPGSRIRIGRILRGNNLTIKDPGISSNHLVIEVHTFSDNRRCWTITDLGASNGTIVNEENIEPLNPVELSDGDIVKIGEKTSIKIGFLSENVGSESGGGNARRNARRGRKPVVAELVVIDEECELGDKDGNLGSFVEEKGRGGRRGRGLVGSELGGNEVEVEEVGKGVESWGTKVGVRRGRKSKKNEESLEVEEEDEDGGEKEVEVGVKQVVATVGMRRTRNSKKNENLSVVDLSVNDLGPSGVKEGGRVGTRRTRSSRLEEGVGEIEVVDLSVIESKKKGKGTRGRKKLNVEEKKKDEELEIEHNICDEDKGKSGVEGKKTDEESDLEHNICEEEKGKSGVEEKKRDEESDLEHDICEEEKGKSGVEEKKKDEESDLEHNICEEEKGKSGVEEKEKDEEADLEHNICEEEKGKSGIGEEVDLGREGGGAGLASTSGFKECGMPYLRKMTVEEWLDFLDVSEPKHIVDATEEILSEMRRKAERLNEFMLQQKKSNENGKAAAE